MNNDFYVGYVPHAPTRLANWVRKVIIGIFAGAAAVALLLVFAQQPFPAAVFEYGQSQTFSGIVREFPAPSLEVDDGRLILLVAPGKHGADVASYSGKAVDVLGSRIQRDGDHMVEIVPGSIRPIDTAVRPPREWVRVGEFELKGEIVDSKCYLGVMNPGDGKVHRDCAARCISGGIPPALIARDSNGRRKLLLLTGSQGRAIQRDVVQFAGETVSVRGPVFRLADQFRIETDPRTINRVE